MDEPTKPKPTKLTKLTAQQIETIRYLTGNRRSAETIADVFQGRVIDGQWGREIHVGILMLIESYPDFAKGITVPEGLPGLFYAPMAPIGYSCQCFGQLGIRRESARYSCNRCGAPCFVPRSAR
jgi:hypothetical protein